MLMASICCLHRKMIIVIILKAERAYLGRHGYGDIIIKGIQNSPEILPAKMDGRGTVSFECYRRA